MNENDPECQDAPSTIVTLITKKGKKVEVGGRINCREVEIRYDDRMRHFELEALRAISGIQAIADLSN